MKGHKKPKCTAEETVQFSDGSTYVGPLYDGKPSGRGRLVRSRYDVYEGDFLDGNRHGRGKQKLPHGIVYEGEWARDKYHGYGILRTADYTYTGKFYAGKYHGEGELCGDDTYKGAWSHGSRHGQGTLTSSAGTYVGLFYYNRRHGKGMQTHTDGSVYTGSWRMDVKHGLGVQSSDIETYTGHWVNNKRQGHGRWESKYLGTYEGQWKRGVRHKRGTHTYVDGSVYNGCWSYGKRTGHGVMRFADGAVYTGFWFDDEMHGRGRLEDTDGRTYKGQWSNGDREGHFVECMDGKTVSHGPWLCDVRHGGFVTSGRRELFLWGTKTAFKTRKQARKALVKMLAKKDALSAEEVMRFYPKLAKWSLLFKHDQKGILLHMLEQSDLEAKFRKHAYQLFRAQRYSFVERMYKLCSDATQGQIAEHAELLFDAMTKEFVANPWVVGDVGYSAATKDKLLRGLHLGEFGRCPPRNPYTRQALAPADGTFLSDMDIARDVYAKMRSAKPKSVETVAYECDLQDFEQSLRNARQVNDRDTIKRLMKERNEFIQRKRTSSSDSHDSQGQ